MADNLREEEGAQPRPKGMPLVGSTDRHGEFMILVIIN